MSRNQKKKNDATLTTNENIRKYSKSIISKTNNFKRKKIKSDSHSF